MSIDGRAHREAAKILGERAANLRALVADDAEAGPPQRTIELDREAS